MNAKQSFREVYALTRLNRGNIHFRGQFFRFAGNRGDIFIDSTGQLVIGRVGVNLVSTPGAAAASIGMGVSKDFRRYCVDAARDTDPVPLP
jgi:hypothetical protein